MSLSDLMSGKLPPPTETSWPEELAIDLLTEALAILEQIVGKKRGQSVVKAIHAAAERRSNSIFGFLTVLEMIKAELQPKKRGRKPLTRLPRRQPGRPRSWPPGLHSAIIDWYERGANELKKQRKPITNVAALREALLAENAALDASERSPARDVDSMARYFAKRLSEARRALLK